MRNVLFDPFTGREYVWRRNHSTVEKSVRAREMEELVPTAAAWEDGVRPILQQGDSSAETLRLAGRIADPVQHAALVAFVVACKTRTVQFTEAGGDTYEVFLLAFEPTRKGVVRAAQSGGQTVWDYTLEMEIVNTL